MMMMVLLLLAVALLPGSQAYLMFQERLPNGNFVPHPCKPNFIWKGVGHMALSGGGARNPFGKDFAENGFKWDKCLCQQDSDGDGRTNGEELGDPDCTWSPGVAAKHKFGLSHPGVCEPVDSPECRELNAFDIDCDAPTEFSCEATQSPDVENITIRFPETQVPPVETTYICMTFDLPSDQAYHMIAHKPIISNHDVMHHIVLYGCREDTPVSLNRILSPAQCGMAEESCSEIIGLWQVGYLGNCFPEEYGFPLGMGGFKTVLLQLHWTNPSQRNDFVDSSGMSLFYTPKLRPNTAGVLMTGQYYLEIPPGRREYGQEGLCSPECTARLPQPVYLTESILHMHYLGASGKTELWREGEKVMDLFSTDDYDYDRPEQRILSPPQELRPGDYIRTRCNYNSKNRGEVTYYGEGSFEEMCFNFITYYPALDFRTCSQYRTSEDCSLREAKDEDMDEDSHTESCTKFFTDESFGAKWATLQANCDPSGLTCRENCKPAVDEFRASPCFQGIEGLATEIYLLENDPNFEKLVYLIHSCDGIFTEAAARATTEESQAVCDALSTDPSFPTRWTDLNEKCDASGNTCKPECPSAVEQFRSSLCFQGVFGLSAELYLNENTPDELPNLIYLLHSCNDVFKEYMPKSDMDEDSHTESCTKFFTDESFGAKWATLQANCDPSGLTCRENCKPAVDEFRASPCFQGVEGLATEIYLLENDPNFEKLVYLIHSCDGIFTEAAARATTEESQAACNALSTDASLTDRFSSLSEKCDASGITCKPECPSAVEQFRSSLCFQGVFGLSAELYINENTPDVFPNLIYLLHSCNGVFNEENLKKSCEDFIMDPSLPSKMKYLAMYCDATGEECKPYCSTALGAFLGSSCFRGSIGRENENYIQRNHPEVPNFHELLHSCDGYEINKDNDDSDENGPNRTEGEGIGYPERYDPERNGLPSGGVCPFTDGNTASAANIVRHSDTALASMFTYSLICTLKALL